MSGAVSWPRKKHQQGREVKWGGNRTDVIRKTVNSKRKHTLKVEDFEGRVPVMSSIQQRRFQDWMGRYPSVLRFILDMEQGSALKVERKGVKYLKRNFKKESEYLLKE
ncbi:hypothetical protein NPIL_312151 [Nephila pilipes]|uniref:Uncharacterized protein n=1 Tax=Nephila pilipes TaxID=299642 RepID=A0A8X6TKB5_NEPPI|nr:hypothetical protein NPIL_312151 [Nephila pilipes]